MPSRLIICGIDVADHLPPVGIARHEQGADRVFAGLRQLEAEPRRLLGEELVRDLHQDAGAVAGARIGADRAAMLEIAEDGERVLDDLVRLAALDVGDEADAAGILVERGIVKALRARAWRSLPRVAGSADPALPGKPSAPRSLRAAWRPPPFARLRPAPILVLASHPSARAGQPGRAAYLPLPQRRSALRPRGTAGHWRPSRHRGSGLARGRSRSAAWRCDGPAYRRPAGRMTNRPSITGRAANWDSNTVLIYPAKF